MAFTSSTSGSEEIWFEPIDFLQEAIEDFLESGAKPTSIGSCIIKIATATELLLKEKLEAICPALVLDTIDKDALQVAKLYNLSKKMINPRELEDVEIKTTSFVRLLDRSAKFFEIREFRSHLIKLHDIRNRLIHHRGQVNLAEVNLLLIDKIFPFCEYITKDDKILKFRIERSAWKRLKELKESSRDEILTGIKKKLAHYGSKVERYSKVRIKLLLSVAQEISDMETIQDEGLCCPACKNPSLSAIRGVDVDYDEGVVSGHSYHTMKCKVCVLDLGQDEIDEIIANFPIFFDKGGEPEKDRWEEAIREPEYSDFADRL
jgi:hypothetical protein